MEQYQEIERSIIKKFRPEIWKPFVQAIKKYDLLQPDDKIAVCVSGGKDSMLLAKCFQELHKHGQMRVEPIFLTMNPGYNQENYDMVMSNAERLHIPLTVFETDIFDTVSHLDGSPCYLCARMRRGYLYKNAQALGCNKIALGHHYDDVIETTLLSMLYSGEIRGMMPKVVSTNFDNMELIRPLYMVKEASILAWMKYNDLQFIQCACRFTENCAIVEGTPDGGFDSKRKEMKHLIQRFRKISPYIESNIFKSLENVNLDTIIGWRSNRDGEHSFLEYYNKGNDSQ